MYRYYLKPLLDILFSLIGVIMVSPVLLFISVILIFINNGKVLFIQQRPGKNERLFKLIKFRTINDLSRAEGNLSTESDRITKAGKLLRNTSLDELPQLINILKGDMSFIGPRPLLKEYLPLYSEFQAKRHQVKPGLSGWAQVNGRNSITWKQKFEHDVYYVENVSFALDLRIFFLTLLKVFQRKDINSSVTRTMEPFTGN